MSPSQNPASAPLTLDTLDSITVVGAGQMGQGIAQVCATSGFTVYLCDASVELAQQGNAKIVKRLERLVEKGKLPPERATQAAARISCIATEVAAAESQLAIEAVSENPELKQRLFQLLDQHLPSNALLASNTSSISITKLAAATGRPERVVGMHFMNPVPIMKLVEIVQGVSTSPETVELTRRLGAKLGKTCVVSRDYPGFIVNRILIPLLNEGCFALQEGVANVQDIDTAIELGLNHPMGPLRLADLIGLDTVLAIAEVLHSELGDDKYRPAALLRNLVAAGHLGQKAGRGFYVYENGKPTGPALSLGPA